MKITCIPVLCVVFVTLISLGIFLNISRSLLGSITIIKAFKTPTVTYDTLEEKSFALIILLTEHKQIVRTNYGCNAPS